VKDTMKKAKNTLTADDIRRAIKALERAQRRCHFCGKWHKEKDISAYLIIYRGILGNVCVSCAKKILALSKRQIQELYLSIYASGNNQKKQTKGSRVGKGRGKETRTKKTNKKR